MDGHLLCLGLLKSVFLGRTVFDSNSHFVMSPKVSTIKIFCKTIKSFSFMKLLLCSLWHELISLLPTRQSAPIRSKTV